jgi:hypothetical protein
MPSSSDSVVARQCGATGQRTPERSDTALALTDLALSDEALRGLIDDWIVPALVDRFLGVRVLPDS